MSNSNKAPASGGIGLSGLLGITFIVLKLCGVIGWPWIWVLSPFWIPLATVLAILLVIVVAVAIVHVIEAATERRKAKGGAK